MLRHKWLLGLLCTVGIVLGGYRLTRATEPLESPRPWDFVKVDILSPRHGDVLKTGTTRVRVRVEPMGTTASDKSFRLHLVLKHEGDDASSTQLDRQGRTTTTPIQLEPGEVEVEIPLKLSDEGGVYSLEAYTDDFAPFSNRAHVMFGINPYLPE